MTVRVSGRLPGKGERDGLQHAERRLRKDREAITVVATLYVREVADVLDKPEDPTKTTLGVLAIEVLDGPDAKAAHELLADAFGKRTGMVALPFGEVPDPDPDE